MILGTFKRKYGHFFTLILVLNFAEIFFQQPLVVQNFEKEKQRLNRIKQNLNQTKIRLNFISEHPAKKKYYYRVLDSANLPRKTLEDENRIVALIADALRGENYVVPLVARSSSNNLEMEKDWELMSDIDKDELIHKKIFRNL